MGNLSLKDRAKISELKERYGITDKQARYVQIDLEAPELPEFTKGKIAGYTPTTLQTDNMRVIKSPKIIKAKKAELARMANIAEEVAKYEENPQQYLKTKFIEHAHDPTIVANQTRALELVGKMDGAFIERIEIDPGRGLRGNLFGDFVKKANVSEEPETGSESA